MLPSLNKNITVPESVSKVEIVTSKGVQSLSIVGSWGSETLTIPYPFVVETIESDNVVVSRVRGIDKRLSNKGWTSDLKQNKATLSSHNMNDKANKVIIESLHMKDRNPLGFTQPRGELVKPKALRSSIKRLFGVLGFQIKDILDTCTMGSHYGMFVNGLGFRVTVRTGKEVPGGEKIPMAVEKPGKIRTLPKLPLGLKADETDTYLEFKIGNSHYSHVRLPKSWHAIVDESKGRYLIVAGGPTKNKVGEFASRIRNLRKLNPYKGTGVRFAGENIVLREGKKQT